jgi:signal transduction histidine kinase/ligand-binding sensor domain-containing protein
MRGLSFVIPMPPRALFHFLRLALPLSLLADAGAAALVQRPYWHTSMVHQAWTKRDGAPGSVYNMAQDQRGMLWFAATDGVYRFDGVRFERLTAIDGNALRSSNIIAITTVGTALWVGYNFGGISVFDQGKVRHYGTADGLPARTVLRMGAAADGVMWAATPDGLVWLDGQRWRAVTPADGLPAGRIALFAALPDGSIQANHLDGIYRNTPGGHHFRRMAPGTGTEIQYLLQNGMTLLSDPQGRYVRYSPLTHRLTPLQLPGGARLVDPFLDMRGAVWINPAAGLTLLGPDLRPLHVFNGLNSLSGKQIFTTMDDREGNLWLTTENGIDRIRESRLTTIALPNRMMRSLSVQSDGEGTVWIGNFKTEDDYQVESFGLRPDGQRLPAPPHNVSATTRAFDGSAWFGNDQTLWQGVAGRWRAWTLAPGLRGNQVQALAVDTAGRLWVSVTHSGVHVFQHGRWQPGGGIAALAGRTAISLMADDRGRVWFGYPDNRLAVLDGGALREYGPDDGLNVGNVTVMASRAGRLWVGGDQGVAVLDQQHFTALKDADGASLHGVSGLVVTSQGELWLHGGDGLIRITAADLAAGDRVRVDRFDYLDGHAGKPPQMRPLSALTETTDGKLWYATSSSVGWVDPARIAHNPRAPATHITALRTDLHQYDARPGLVLPDGTRDLEINFTAPTLTIPERIRFRYRLNGMDDKWRDAGTRRAAFYTNLGPGDYRFEVLAANEDGVWAATPATLSFRIAPTFLQTGWFKLLCSVLVLVLAALLYWRRMASVAARITDRLRERLRERERIARSLHDNFLQSVQALMMQFNLIKHGLPPDDPVHAKIDAALDTAEDVLNEGREQVLALRLNHELTGDLESALSGLGHILAARHGARFVLLEQGKRRPLRAVAAAEAYAIGREALLNALRHAHSAEVVVELRYARTQFSLQVRDQGCGMSAEVIACGHRPGHFGLTGMRERAVDTGGTLDVRSRAGVGTAVTLRLPARRAYARNAADKLPKIPS